MADRSELVAELKGRCRGEGLDEAHSLMVMVPEDVEIAHIKDTLHTVKCCDFFPHSEPSTSTTDILAGSG